MEREPYIIDFEHEVEGISIEELIEYEREMRDSIFGSDETSGQYNNSVWSELDPEFQRRLFFAGLVNWENLAEIHRFDLIMRTGMDNFGPVDENEMQRHVFSLRQDIAFLQFLRQKLVDAGVEPEPVDFDRLPQLPEA